MKTTSSIIYTLRPDYNWRSVFRLAGYLLGLCRPPQLHKATIEIAAISGEASIIGITAKELP